LPARCAGICFEWKIREQEPGILFTVNKIAILNILKTELSGINCNILAAN